MEGGLRSGKTRLVADPFAAFAAGNPLAESPAERRPGFRSQVEEVIAARVAELNRELFVDVAAFCGEQCSFIDPTLDRFDREIQFYLTWHDLTTRLAARELPFPDPEVVCAPATRVESTFDLALALRMTDGTSVPVTNGFSLLGEERFHATNSLARVNVSA